MPLFKGFALTFILYNCRKRDYTILFKHQYEGNQNKKFIVE